MLQAKDILAPKSRNGQTNPLLRQAKRIIFGLARRGLLKEAKRLEDADRKRAVDEVLNRRQKYVIEDPAGLKPYDYVGVFCARTCRLICAVPVAEVTV